MPLMHIVLKNRMPHFLIKRNVSLVCGVESYGILEPYLCSERIKNLVKEAISMLIHNLVHGEDIVIFPEGTRNRTQQLLLPLKKGLYMFHKFLKNQLFQLQLRNMEENM
ncbi:MAG: 1-acyl-sn-glycerol-3-phosphate acyltransferase [Clostridium sp.]